MNTQIYEEATNWLIKHREIDLNYQEKREFDTWLRQSPQHVQAYLEMSAVWEDLPALDPSWNPTPDQLIARARSDGNVHPLVGSAPITLGARRHSPDPRSAHRPRFARLSFALAAAFLLAVLGVTSWYWRNDHNLYSTAVGEQRSIVLADGSTLELNSRSRIRVRYTEAQRDVDLLEGQALFRVAHNKSRPFVVHSGSVSMRAVGTQFDVYRKKSDTVVTVVEGQVAVAEGNPPTTGQGYAPLLLEPQTNPRTGATTAILLAAGEQLTIPAAQPSGGKETAAVESPQWADVAAATAWTQRTLVFESSPLTNVAEEFNRYNTRQLVITDPGVANIRITGMFSSVDPALLLSFLHTQPELNVQETETEIRISKR